MILAIQFQILADAVENDDRVGNGQAEDGEKRNHEERVDFRTAVVRDDGEDAGRNHDVVKERDDRDDSVLPRFYRTRNASE